MPNNKLRHAETKTGSRAKRAARNLAVYRAAESLERRVLFAAYPTGAVTGPYNLSLTGGTLSVTNPSGQVLETDPGLTGAITLDGAVGGSTFTIVGPTPVLTLSGSGGDTFVVDAASGAGTKTITIQSAPVGASSDSLVVQAPSASAADMTVSPTGVYTAGGTTVLFGSGAIAQLSVQGQLLGAADALTVDTGSADAVTVNGSELSLGLMSVYYSTFTNLTINGNGDPAERFTVDGDSLPTVINANTKTGAGAGTVDFDLTSSSMPLTLNGGGANDLFTIGGNFGQLNVTGGQGKNTFNVLSNYSTADIDGGPNANSFNVTSNAGDLNFVGTGTADTYTVYSTAGQLVGNELGSSGTNAFTLYQADAPVTYDGGHGTDAVTITAPLDVTPSINGGNDTTLDYTLTRRVDTVDLGDGVVSVAYAADVDYAGLAGLTVHGLTGNDLYTVDGDASPTTLIGGGTDEYDVRSDSAVVTVDTAPGHVSTINVGSNAPGLTGGTIAPIAGGVTVTGNGGDLLNIDDTGDTAPASGTLGSDGLSAGFNGAGPIGYAGIAKLNLNLGSGGNNLVISGTAATVTAINTGSGNDRIAVQATGLGTTTSINGGSGTNFFGVGSQMPDSGSILDNLQGVFTLTGSGKDAVAIDDSENDVAKTGTLAGNGTAGSLTGFSPVPIPYTGIASVYLGLGGGPGDGTGDKLTIPGTISGTTDVDDVVGAVNTITLLNDQGPTTLDGDEGTSTIAIRGISAPTTVTAAVSGSTMTVVGTDAPAGGGVLTGILAPLTVNGSDGSDLLTVDDTGATAAATGTLSPTTVTGLGLPAAGSITYAGTESVAVNLGNAGNTFVVTGTSASGSASVTGGTGKDTIAVQSDAGPTTVNTSAGATDAVYVLTTAGTTSVTTSGTVVVGSAAPAVHGGNLDGVTGAVTVTGTPSAVLTLDDSASTLAKNGTLTATTLTVVAGAPVTYSGISTLTLGLGVGGDTLNVQGTAATTTHISVSGGTNIFNLGSLAPATGGVTAGIAGTLTVAGAGHDTFNVDDSGDAAHTSGSLTPTQVVGLTKIPLAYAGMSATTVSLGTAGNAFTVVNTIAGTNVVNGGTGADTITVDADAGPTTVTGGGGADRINVLTTGAATTIEAGTGPAVIDVSTTAPAAGGKLTSINGPLSVDGGGTATLNLDDSGVATSVASALSAAAVTGLSPASITYANLAAFNLTLGNGGNNLTVTGTAVGTASTVNTGAGNDTVSVRGTGGPTFINTGAGKNTTTITSTAPTSGGIVGGILAPVTVTGDGTDTLTIDDGGDKIATTGKLTGSALTGIATVPIDFTGLSTFTLTLGSGGNTLAIASTPTGATTTINTGAGNDAVTMTTDAGPTTINTGAGQDIVNLVGTGAATTINTGGNGADLVTIGTGDAAPAAGVLTGLTGAVVVNGSGSDTVAIDDSGLTTPTTSGQLTATAVTGLSPASITFSKLAAVDVYLGGGPNTFVVAGTPTGATAMVTGGAGVDTIDVRSTAGPTTIAGNGGADVVNVGSLAPAAGGTVTGIVGPVTVTDTGAATLTVDDTGTTTARTATVTSTALTVGSATVAYSGVAVLNVNLGGGGNTIGVNNTSAGSTTTIRTGSGADTVNIRATAGPTTVNAGAGKNTFKIGSLAPANGGTLGGLAGPLTLVGSGSDSLALDDTGSATARTGTVSATAITGLGTAGISYSNMSSLAVSLGNAGNSLTVTGTNAATPVTITGGAGVDDIAVQSTKSATTLNTGTGADVVTLGSLAPALGGTMANITGAVSVTGGGGATLTLDDSADAAAKTVAVTAKTVSGLAPSTVTFAGLMALNVDTGLAADKISVNGTAANTATATNEGTGSDAVTVSTTDTNGLPADLAGTLAINGGAGTNTLVVDDSADKTGRTVTVAPSGITGLGAGITYFEQSTLSIKLGAGNDSAKVTGIGSTTATTIDGGGGTNTGVVSVSGDYNGTLKLTTIGTTSLAVSGNLNGSLTTSGAVSTAAIGGSLAGTLSITGNATTVTVGTDLSGSLAVGGQLTGLTFGGNESGTISAGSVGTVAAPAAGPTGSAGTVLSVTQAGVPRQVLATGIKGGATSGLTFKLLYDGATNSSRPQVAVRVFNPDSARFDLTVQAAETADFDLSRLDTSGPTVAADVRNIVAGGSFLTAVTASQAAYMGYPVTTAGGIFLPVDNVAGLTSWCNLYANTIRVNSLEGLAFSDLYDSSGHSHVCNTFTTAATDALLLTVLTVNPATKQYYASINLPTDPMVIPDGIKTPVALFVDGTYGNIVPTGTSVGTPNNGQFQYHGVIVTDEASMTSPTAVYASQTLLVDVAFASNAAAHTSWITSLHLVGDGGAIDSAEAVESITSTGAVGDLYLRGNAPTSAAVLANKVALGSVTIPSEFGNVDLFGGSLTGTFQTTGLRTDPVTGATSTVTADLGALSGSGYLHAELPAGSAVVSRGNLLSTVETDAPLDGTVAVAGNIGGYSAVGKTGALSRFGGIKSSSTGTSTGEVVALGNVFGDIVYAGPLAGRIAAKGAAVTGLATGRIGIFGSVMIAAGGLTAGGAVVSGGEIGDSLNGTKLAVTGGFGGFVAAKGAVTASPAIPSSDLVQNQTGAGSTVGNAAALNSIWTNASGQTLGLDVTGEDLAGLASISGELSDLSLAGGVLS